MTKIIFISGNGGSTTKDNWFPSLKTELEPHPPEVIDAEFPDPILARKSFWIPYLIETLNVDDDTILVGYSSVAIAAVGAYYTDLGMESEKKSGYFDRPWDFDKIIQNQKWTIIFSSQDDPWIPIEQPRYIHKNLNCEYHEYKDQGHFGGDYFKSDFPELSAAILRKIKKLSI